MGFRLRQKSLTLNNLEREFTALSSYCDKTAEDRISGFLIK